MNIKEAKDQLKEIANAINPIISERDREARISLVKAMFTHEGKCALFKTMISSQNENNISDDILWNDVSYIIKNAFDTNKHTHEQINSYTNAISCSLKHEFPLYKAYFALTNDMRPVDHKSDE